MARIQALFFDVDGTIADTERDGHRVAFNAAFRELGCDVVWDVDTYREQLRVAGGKERMRRCLERSGRFPAGVPEPLIESLHARKTEIFIGLIRDGRLPLRPGVRRLMTEALEAGLRLGICSTSSERSVEALRQAMLPDIPFEVVLAGDVVRRKKPDPEIYRLALARTGLPAEAAIAVEDSANGVRAGKAAGMFVVATTNGYTEQEDLSEADLVLTALGDPEGEKGVLRQAAGPLDFDGCLHLDALLACVARPA